MKVYDEPVNHRIWDHELGRALADAAETLLEHYHALDQARGGNFGWSAALREWGMRTPPFTWEAPSPLVVRLAVLWEPA